MKREFSAGGIIFNNLGQVLLINNAAMRDPNKNYWGFPKGHLLEKESSVDAAIREVKEETGLEVEIVEKLGDHKYVFTIEGEKIFKVVTIFLMQQIGGEIKIQTEELLGADWFTPEEGLKKLSFSADKSLLKRALEIRDGE